jgi:hypothetical protein
MCLFIPSTPFANQDSAAIIYAKHGWNVLSHESLNASEERKGGTLVPESSLLHLSNTTSHYRQHFIGSYAAGVYYRDNWFKFCKWYSHSPFLFRSEKRESFPYRSTENAEEELALFLFLILLQIARLKTHTHIHTVVEGMRLELLDVCGGAQPPLLVAAIAEPHAAAEAGSKEQQEQ